MMVRGCGAVGRAVASDSMDPQIEPRHLEIELIYLSTAFCWEARVFPLCYADPIKLTSL